MFISVPVYLFLSRILFTSITHNYISEYLLSPRNLSIEVNENIFGNTEVIDGTYADTSNKCKILHPGTAAAVTLSLAVTLVFNPCIKIEVTSRQFD